ncbi:MAG: ABC transporter ATP-binding protein [Lachnospiraceae bacterium]
MSTQKKQNNLAQLLTFAGSHKWLTLLGCVLSGISAVFMMAPYICIWLIAKNLFIIMPDWQAAGDLIGYGWLALKMVLTGMLLYFASLMCTHLAAFRTARNMRIAAAEHLIDVPLGFFQANQSGKLRKLIDDNAGMTESLLAHQLPDLVGAIVTPAAAVIMLFVFDWRMGLLCLVPMALSVVLLGRMMGGENANFFSRYQIATENLSTEATEYVRGIPVVKVFQQTVYSFKAFHSTIISYRDMASEYTMSCRAPMTAFTTVLNGTFCLLIPAGIYLCSTASDAWTTFANLLFYILFAPMCGLMMSRIMYAAEAMMQSNEAVRKLDEIRNAPVLADESSSACCQGADIEFRNVTFTYPGAVTPALSQVSFRIPEHSTVALVGPSGSGKSTAASLIPRFWDVSNGQILIGGSDIRSLSSNELMNQVAFVFQDSHLFKTSLLENIRAARPDATMEQVMAAVSAAQCDDIIRKLPDGLHTIVGTRGIYLSGGECQRIALARAILKDAPVVILDEATAFADPENENLIQKAFEHLTKGKTVLMIAHRLTTIQNADSIMVMNHGQITESGTHRQLLESGGLYASMWNDYQTSARWKVEHTRNAEKEVQS